MECRTDGGRADPAAVLGADDLSDNPDYRNNEGRIRHRAVVCGRIAELTARRSRDDLLAAFERHGIPAGPINDIGEVFADPQVVARGLRSELQSGGTAIPTVACPIVMDGERMIAAKASPKLGEDSEAVLSELGIASSAKE